MLNANMPLVEAILQYTSTHPLPFHMPGHKLGKAVELDDLKGAALFDLTEIPGTDNLHFPQGAILDAQKFAAEAFGSGSTFFLVNGSTCGIHAAILSICKPDQKLIISRDCHQSAIAGMMLAGAVPIYIKPTFERYFGIPGAVRAEDIEAALQSHPDAAGVFVTSPNYYGICPDIEQIARIVHSYGKVLVVDEAHGAHLCFHSRLPSCAMKSGADICVQSAHKTLPAFTQGALLHLRLEYEDTEKVKSYLNMLQTTSPSYIIMAALDMARAIMQSEGSRRLELLLSHIDCFAGRIMAKTRLKILQEKDIGHGRMDPTRLVINCKSWGISGYEVERYLRSHYNIQVEMSDLYNILCITTIADGKEDFEKLAEVLEEMDKKIRGTARDMDTFVEETGLPSQRIPLKAMMQYPAEKISLDKAMGRISHGMLTPYPPGIPLICPGEEITPGILEYITNILKAGGVVNGLGNDQVITVLKL